MEVQQQASGHEKQPVLGVVAAPMIAAPPEDGGSYLTSLPRRLWGDGKAGGKDQHRKVTREEVDLLTQPSSRCFLLSDVLGAEECAELIEAAECAGSDGGPEAGWEMLARLFPTDYRGGDRLLVMDEQLAQLLWLRIKPALTRNDVLRVRPIGALLSPLPATVMTKRVLITEIVQYWLAMDCVCVLQDLGTRERGSRIVSTSVSSSCATSLEITSRTMQPSCVPYLLDTCVRMLPLMTVCGSGHVDGPWVPRSDESSVYTVIIYLNDDFKGGCTNFRYEGTLLHLLVFLLVAYSFLTFVCVARIQRIVVESDSS